MNLDKIASYLRTVPVNSEQFKTTLQELWKNNNFSGSYSGVLNFQRCLKYDLNIDVSQTIVRKALQNISTFAHFMRVSKKTQTRHFNVHGSLQLWQSGKSYQRFINCFSITVLL